MNFQAIEIPDVYIIEPQIYRDQRGYFFEIFNIKDIDKNIEIFNVIQENQSKSKYGVIRGLHYQKPPFNQAKIVSVIKGEVLDVIVDIRTDSPTFGKHFSIILNGSNKLQLFVPRGFAHGFITLSKDAIFQYNVDNFYSPNYDTGIRFDDEYLNINWKVNNKLNISKKDRNLPFFNQCQFFKKTEYYENPE